MKQFIEASAKVANNCIVMSTVTLAFILLVYIAIETVISTLK